METAAQLQLLRALGCRFAQGFYFAHPLEVREVPGLLMENGAQ